MSEMLVPVQVIVPCSGAVRAGHLPSGEIRVFII